MTFNEIITYTRNIINDVDKVRWSDEDMMTYANEYVVEVREIRPDLFLGTYLQTIPVYDGTDPFPLPRRFEKYLTDWLVHRAHCREEEYINDGRAVAFLQMFRTGLLQT